MEIKSYYIFYDDRVVKEDIPKLDHFWKEKIKSAIISKLGQSPEVFGKPLRKSLVGNRSLRVGDYRVIFHIDNKEVYIHKIAHRRDIYQ